VLASARLSGSAVTMSISAALAAPSFSSTARAICSCWNTPRDMIAAFAPSDFSIATPTASTATRSLPAIITLPALSSPREGPPSVNAWTPSRTIRSGR
jgi:hypothetical protein